MKTNKFVKFFFAEPDDLGGGDDDGGSPALDILNDDPTGDDEPVKVTPAAPAAPAFDPTALANAFKDAIQPLVPKDKPAEISLEERKKLLKEWEPDDTFFTKLGNIDTQKQAWLEARDRLIEQADMRMQLRLHQMRQQMEAEYAPLREQFAAQQEAQLNEAFGKAYPALSNPKLQPVIGAVVQSLKAEGKQFNSREELFTALASRIESVMQVSNPEFKLTAAQAASTKTNGNAIPVTTPGGGGGGGKGKGQVTAGKPRALQILG